MTVCRCCLFWCCDDQKIMEDTFQPCWVFMVRATASLIERLLANTIWPAEPLLTKNSTIPCEYYLQYSDGLEALVCENLISEVVVLVSCLVWVKEKYYSGDYFYNHIYICVLSRIQSWVFECNLLEFNWHSKPLGQNGRLFNVCCDKNFLKQAPWVQ